MQHLKSQQLKDYTTLKVGGTADNLFIPSNLDELKELVGEHQRKGYHLLGNGSNIFVASRRIRKPVILIGQALQSIEIDQTSGVVRANAGADIRKMITDSTRCGLRAPVELLTIPATVGGALFMNAGRSTLKTTISDHLHSVEVFDGRNTFTLDKQQCEFGHRHSLFHRRRDWTILSAEFRYQSMPSSELQAIRRSSLDAAKDKCYRRHASAGTVFKICDDRLIKRMRGRRFSDAAFSESTTNCILNYGSAKPWQIRALISLAIASHWIRRKSIHLELEIW
ncbi:FAD-binding protein [Stieleria sp. TO1_6]|uniref:FAD-binding protein n=1 Tax=Stieleria tagensis TaxID=2956795 RepID=UPI00209B9C61|nr:FAD-binding protein [Stieleria tagensis]MCO8120681.1 FAD-binding protein [Stieleria tagensis]